MPTDCKTTLLLQQVGKAQSECKSTEAVRRQQTVSLKIIFKVYETLDHQKSIVSGRKKSSFGTNIFKQKLESFVRTIGQRSTKLTQEASDERHAQGCPPGLWEKQEAVIRAHHEKNTHAALITEQLSIIPENRFLFLKSQLNSISWYCDRHIPGPNEFYKIVSYNSEMQSSSTQLPHNYDLSSLCMV